MRYRELATRPMAKWAIVAVGARLPVAMATLALVFLVRDRPGGYAAGAGLAAVYVLGEVAGASVLGPRLKRDRVRRQLAAGLALGGSSSPSWAFCPARHCRCSPSSPRWRGPRRPQPALLEERAIRVGWAGPLLAGFSIAAILGATVYGARGSWPGSVRAQSVVLLLGATTCVTQLVLAGIGTNGG